jgi:chromosome segregation ATPase
MSINVKKYTKDQMAKMVEEAQEAAEKMNGCMNELRSRNSELELQVRTLKAKNAALTEQIDQMNGEAINKANEIANLKADADALRNKLADTEAALGRANACIATMQVEKDQQTKELFEWRSSAQALHDDLLDARDRANYAESHPWRNLWAWVKRKMVRRE